MTGIAIVACSKSKQAEAAPARELYTSPLFRKSLAVAERFYPERTFILSAKHGLVTLDETLEPYDVTVASMTLAERVRWGRRVRHNLHVLAARIPVSGLFILGGRLYVEPFASAKIPIVEPLAGLQIGQRLHKLNRILDELEVAATWAVNL